MASTTIPTTGVVLSLQVTKNFMLQLAITNGTEAAFWNARSAWYPPVAGGVLYQPVPGVFATTTAQAYYQGQVDPGVKPTFSGCARYQTDTAYDNLYCLRERLQHGSLRLQQSATVRLHLLPQVRRQVAHRHRGLAHA